MTKKTKTILKLLFVILCIGGSIFSFYLLITINKWDPTVINNELHGKKTEPLKQAKVVNKTEDLSSDKRKQNVEETFELTKKPSNGLIYYKEELLPGEKFYSESVFIKDGLRYTVKHNKWNFKTPLHIFVRINGTTGEENLTSLHYTKEGICILVKLPSGNARKTYDSINKIFDMDITEAQKFCDKILILVNNYLKENKKG